MNVDFEDNGNDEYGLVFSRDSEYDPLPSFQFNDRGEVHIEAKVTPRMMPGVVALGEGAWYNPDASRVDQAGSINVLTTQRPSPLAKGNPSHTNLVQVEKL